MEAVVYFCSQKMPVAIWADHFRDRSPSEIQRRAPSWINCPTLGLISFVISHQQWSCVLTAVISHGHVWYLAVHFLTLVPGGGLSDFFAWSGFRFRPTTSYCFVQYLINCNGSGLPCCWWQLNSMSIEWHAFFCYFLYDLQNTLEFIFIIFCWPLDSCNSNHWKQANKQKNGSGTCQGL